MKLPETDARVAFLCRADAYPDARSVEVVETHRSWVFLTERHAFKLKKPVRHEGLDFTTPERRREACEDEVRLNRRLAPDVYLGVAALTLDAAGEVALGGGGEPIDWLVSMRRLPAHRMLDELIRRGGVEEEDVRGAAELLADFYGRSEAVDITPEQYRRRLAEGVRFDLRELSRARYDLPRAAVSVVAQEQLALLKGEGAAFDRRVRAGRIVEGHGDLRPEHVCLCDPPAIIDCLEFSRDLRVVDPADELVFLALECERLGAPVVGRWFLDAYVRTTGDDPPPPVLCFHRRFRALRRATISAWHLDDEGVLDHRRWRGRALRYLDLAAAAGAPGPP